MANNANGTNRYSKVRLRRIERRLSDAINDETLDGDDWLEHSGELLTEVHVALCQLLYDDGAELIRLKAEREEQKDAAESREEDPKRELDAAIEVSDGLSLALAKYKAERAALEGAVIDYGTIMLDAPTTNAACFVANDGRGEPLTEAPTFDALMAALRKRMDTQHPSEDPSDVD